MGEIVPATTSNGVPHHCAVGQYALLHVQIAFRVNVVRDLAFNGDNSGYKVAADRLAFNDERDGFDARCPHNVAQKFFGLAGQGLLHRSSFSRSPNELHRSPPKRDRLMEYYL